MTTFALARPLFQVGDRCGGCRRTDRHPPRSTSRGFGLAYAGFAVGGSSILALVPCFVAAGVAIGCVETAEHAAVAALAPVELRGSAFGLLAAVQSFGNLAASTIAGLLWTLASPPVAFGYLVAWMVLALAGLLLAERRP
jgi:Major Facilitator Superfamily